MKSKTGIVPLLYLSLFVLTSCNMFPRDNPIDPVNSDDEEADGGALDSGVPNINLARNPTINDSLEFDDQNNNNGVVEAGETIRFVAELKNEGDETITGVAATISSSDPCVAPIPSATSRAWYGDIEPGRIGPSSAAADSFSYEVRFSPTECSVGNNVDISLEVRDDSDNRWSIPIEFKIVENELSIEIVEQFVNDASQNQPCNDDNAFFEIGETVEMNFRIRNSGSSYARDVQARLLWESAGDCVRFPRGEARKSEWLKYGDIEPGGIKIAEQSEVFIVETDVEQCSEGPLDLVLEIRDASERFLKQPIRLPVENINLTRLYVNLVHDDDDFIDDSDAYFEGNDDHGDANPGEVIHLKIDLRNDGSVPARPVRFAINRSEQNLPRCVSDWRILQTPEDPRSFGEIDFGQSIIGWVLEVILSDDDCESGENIGWVVKVEDRCAGEITIPVTMTIN